jgi:serine/threonine protein kinase
MTDPILSVGIKYLPELFVWTVFRNLVNACIYLRARPATIEGASPFPTIHFDIKPENVLLMSNPNPAEPYPRPVLSDFESYFRLWDEYITNDNGTQQGFFAPEQLGPYPNAPVAVDIFQIGATIWCITRNKRIFLSTSVLCANTLPQQMRDEDERLCYEAPYSKSLEDLVQRCLIADGRLRPDIFQLQQEVAAKMATFSRNNGSCLGKRKEDLPDWWRIEPQEDGGLRVGAPLGCGKKRRLRKRIENGPDKEFDIPMYGADVTGEGF